MLVGALFRFTDEGKNTLWARFSLKWAAKAVTYSVSNNEWAAMTPSHGQARGLIGAVLQKRFFAAKKKRRLCDFWIFGAMPEWLDSQASWRFRKKLKNFFAGRLWKKWKKRPLLGVENVMNGHMEVDEYLNG